MDTSNAPFVLVILALISSGPSLIQAFYAALAYHRPPGAPVVKHPISNTKWRFWVATIFPVLAWCAAGFDYYDRHYNVPLGVPVPAWGVSTALGETTPTYMAIAGTQPIMRYQKKDKLILISRNAWAGTDRLTDTVIEKSAPFSIDNGAVQLQFKGKGIIKYAAGQMNSIELYIVMLPNDISPDQITRLADVEKVGGVVLARTGQNVEGAIPPGAIPLPFVAQSPPSVGSGAQP
jgi:hypothetical protein